MHDVDLIAMDEKLSYECSNEKALHLTGKLYEYNDKKNRKERLIGSFGGVSSVSPRFFEKVNGYSNEYWGWGGEDDDFFLRLYCYKIWTKQVATRATENWYSCDLSRLLKHNKPIFRLKM